MKKELPLEFERLPECFDDDDGGVTSAKKSTASVDIKSIRLYYNVSPSQQQQDRAWGCFLKKCIS